MISRVYLYLLLSIFLTQGTIASHTDGKLEVDLSSSAAVIKTSPSVEPPIEIEKINGIENYQEYLEWIRKNKFPLKDYPNAQLYDNEKTTFKSFNVEIINYFLLILKKIDKEIEKTQSQKDIESLGKIKEELQEIAKEAFKENLTHIDMPLSRYRTSLEAITNTFHNLGRFDSYKEMQTQVKSTKTDDIEFRVKEWGGADGIETWKPDSTYIFYPSRFMYGAITKYFTDGAQYIAKTNSASTQARGNITLNLRPSISMLFEKDVSHVQYGSIEKTISLDTTRRRVGKNFLEALLDLREENLKNLTVETIEQKLYREVRILGFIPGNFPTLMPQLLALKLEEEFFGGKKVDWNWIDPCGGWGDRLVAALGSMRKNEHGKQTEQIFKSYTSFDPNAALKPGYDKIVEVLGESLGESHKCAIETHTACAEDQSIEALRLKKPNLIFTSPPYGVSKDGVAPEAYSRDEKQSYIKYPTPDSWKTNFLQKLAYIYFCALEPGGIYALNMSDTSLSTDICLAFNNYMKTLPYAKYRGCWALRIETSRHFQKGKADTITAEPLWIWQKDGNAVSIPRSLSESAAASNYIQTSDEAEHSTNQDKKRLFSELDPDEQEVVNILAMSFPSSVEEFYAEEVNEPKHKHARTEQYAPHVDAGAASASAGALQEVPSQATALTRTATNFDVLLPLIESERFPHMSNSSVNRENIIKQYREIASDNTTSDRNLNAHIARILRELY